MSPTPTPPSVRRSTRDDRLPPDLRPLREEDFGPREARHLLLRAGFGGTPEQIEALAERGLRAAVNHLVDYAAIPFDGVRSDAFDSGIMRPLTPEQRRIFREAQQRQDEDTLAAFREERQRRQREDRRQMRAIQRWWLERMIETPRPLEEKMTLFWHGHFATSYRTIEDSYHMFRQNQLFRSMAVGNFGALLSQIIRDPAMLAYLDNNDSRKGRPNENLARELLELFGLGVGNYTEADVREGARALTGYTFEDDAFVFREAAHDGGEKTILGATGRLDGDGFVRAILAQRACAEFLAVKLYRFFVQHIPEEQPDRADLRQIRFVRALAAEIRANEYELRPVLQRLFRSRHFYHPSILNRQIKSPVELAVGTIRSLRTPVRDLSAIVDALDRMGQNLFFPPSVKGWDGGVSWINTSTLFVRQNLAGFLLTGHPPEGGGGPRDRRAYDPAPLLAPLAAESPAGAGRRDPDRVLDHVMRFALGSAPPRARETLRAFVRDRGDEMDGETLTRVLLLVTSMPEFQLC